MYRALLEWMGFSEPHASDPVDDNVPFGTTVRRIAAPGEIGTLTGWLHCNGIRYARVIFVGLRSTYIAMVDARDLEVVPA